MQLAFVGMTLEKPLGKTVLLFFFLNSVWECAGGFETVWECAEVLDSWSSCFLFMSRPPRSPCLVNISPIHTTSSSTPSSSRLSSSRSRWVYNYPQAPRQRRWQSAQCQPYWRQCGTATGIISGESWSKSWNGAPDTICQPERLLLLSEILALGLTREGILWGVSGTSWPSFPLKTWRNVNMNQYL